MHHYQSTAHPYPPPHLITFGHLRTFLCNLLLRGVLITSGEITLTEILPLHPSGEIRVILLLLFYHDPSSSSISTQSYTRQWASSAPFYFCHGVYARFVYFLGFPNFDWGFGWFTHFHLKIVFFLLPMMILCCSTN